jgi:acetyl/propionyl-CoA carboxylase alpha subunit
MANGHALECRLYAEDPENDDLPSPGRILLLAAPQGPGVRFDGGIDTGSEVTVHYDPLLAKIVTWGRSRSESVERMRTALRQTTVLGVVTNQARLQGILAHPEFEAGRLHTGFIDEHLTELGYDRQPPPEALAAAAMALGASTRAAGSGQGMAPPDPWASLHAWRLS